MFPLSISMEDKENSPEGHNVDEAKPLFSIYFVWLLMFSSSVTDCELLLRKSIIARPVSVGR